MSAAHDPLFAAARVTFCAALSRAGVHYNALALDLESTRGTTCPPRRLSRLPCSSRPRPRPTPGLR